MPSDVAKSAKWGLEILVPVTDSALTGTSW